LRTFYPVIAVTQSQIKLTGPFFDRWFTRGCCALKSSIQSIWTQLVGFHTKGHLVRDIWYEAPQFIAGIPLSRLEYEQAWCCKIR